MHESCRIEKETTPSQRLFPKNDSYTRLTETICRKSCKIQGDTVVTIRLKMFFASVLRVPPRTPMSNAEGAARGCKTQRCVLRCFWFQLTLWPWRLLAQDNKFCRRVFTVLQRQLIWCGRRAKKNKSVGEDGLNHPSGVEDGPNFSAVVGDVKMEDGRIP